MLAFHPSIVRMVEALELHGSQTLARPAVQMCEQVERGSKGWMKIIHRSADHSVEFQEDFGIQIVRSDG